MRSSKVFLSLGVALIIACFQNVAAQPKNPQTVTDYYLLLTKEELSILESVENRRSIIKTEDTKNGFLRLEGLWEGWAEIALFRKTNREAVIAINQVGCGPACEGSSRFVTFKNGTWTDVTAQVLSKPTDKDVLAAYNRLKPSREDAHTLEDMPLTYWIMPQRGTVIKLVVGDDNNLAGKTLLTFNWNGKRFVRTTK